LNGNLIVALVIIALVAIAVAKVAYDLRVGKHCDYCGGNCECCGACRNGTVTVEEDGGEVGEKKE
jgi:hypothetical protein